MIQLDISVIKKIKYRHNTLRGFAKDIFISFFILSIAIHKFMFSIRWILPQYVKQAILLIVQQHENTV